MKRIVFIAILLSALFVLPARAQRFGGPEGMKGKIIVGGNIGAGYYGNTLSFSIAPQVGYRLTRSLEVGSRLGYHLNYHGSYYSAYGPYFDHFFTGSLYANYEIISGIYAQVEDEAVCCLVSGPNITSSRSQWFNSFLIGGGYRQYSGSSYVFYSLLYDLSWDYMYLDNNPYNSPFIIRVGFCYAIGGKRK